MVHESSPPREIINAIRTAVILGGGDPLYVVPMVLEASIKAALPDPPAWSALVNDHERISGYIADAKRRTPELFIDLPSLKLDRLQPSQRFAAIKHAIASGRRRPLSRPPFGPSFRR